MFEIGTECAAVLVKLNELLAQIPVGDVVHVVTDDPTSPIEMVRWSDESGQPVIDERKEGSLFHFLVRKVS
jgi:TusA-related sulfurtransferase